MKRFHYDCRLQFYLYAFLYVNLETILYEDYFQLQKIVADYNNMSTPRPVTKYFLGFSYIRLEGYELYMKIYKSETKRKSDH